MSAVSDLFAGPVEVMLCRAQETIPDRCGSGRRDRAGAQMGRLQGGAAGDA